MSEFVAVKSPCISVCVINAGTGYCLGCFRTTDEIANWQQRSSGNAHASFTSWSAGVNRRNKRMRGPGHWGQTPFKGV